MDEIVSSESSMSSRVIEAMLRQRGFCFDSDADLAGVLLPIPGTEEQLDRYYRLLQRYSFRIFLRDVIKFGPVLAKADLLHYCSPAKVDRYLGALLDLGIIVPEAPGFRLGTEKVHSFGDTLEFHLAQIFRREFLAPATWRVKLHGLRPGGDFDLLAVLSGRLTFVEVKSSPPKNIHQDTITEFLRRYQVLRPDLGILFIDTHLRLADKINKMMCRGLQELSSSTPTEPLALKRGLFLIQPGLYTMSAKPDIALNLRACLRHFFTDQRAQAGRPGQKDLKNQANWG